jgi:putative nucleotidyltransferase with HDIG domain
MPLPQAPAWFTRWWGDLRTHQWLAPILTGLALVCFLVEIRPNWWPRGVRPDWWPAEIVAPLNFVSVLGVIGLVGMAIYLYATFLRHHEPAVSQDRRRIYLIALVTVATFGILWLLESLHASPYLLPLPAAAMLLKIFVNPMVAIGTTAVMAILGGVAHGSSGLGPVIVGVGTSLAAVFAVPRIRQRSDLARAGLIAGLFGAALTIVIGMISGGHPMLWGPHALWAVIGGVGSAVLAVGILPYLEGLFGITTTFKLMELANPSQPLLRYLLMKAPGTYHHSILVGNLGEAAAEAVGADPLLVRVGAYYHDIGKTKRPYFFIENQMGMENAHEKISPHLSALVIQAHVKEGLEIAKEYALPPDVTRFVSTHHGKSCIAYFYHQACEAEGSDHVEEDHFRYPGPRPNTKEEAIVMLADACEATVRTLKNPTPEQIEETIRRLINKRLNDGELTEAPLTLAEIEVIAQTFLKIVQGLYHQRIEYPDQLMKDLKKDLKRETKEKKLGSLPG